MGEGGSLRHQGSGHVIRGEIVALKEVSILDLSPQELEAAMAEIAILRNLR